MARLLLILCAALAATQARNVIKREAPKEYKMCVAEELVKQCEYMATQTTKSTAKITCIPARDRIDCIEKIKEHLADFAFMDPEDMYIAGNMKDDEFRIFEEVRTKEEPEADFRYEAVAVVPNDLQITKVTQLKGLRSCHTGVGRNVGYKVPITKLKNMGIIGKLNNPEMSPRENELSALSKLFSKACIVGKWSTDTTINKLWKQRYANLCELCEDPGVCDYPDKFSGYEGALNCLAHNGGQVAWTKVIFVRKFFGLPVGTTEAKNTTEDATKFSYFCPDGTKVPVTEKPCTWAARPWQGFVANTAVIKTVDDLRTKIENLDELGHKTHASWLQKVLEVGENNIVKPGPITSPMQYLEKAKYVDVLGREYGPPTKMIRFCTITKDEMMKCEALSKSAFSRNIRPRFGCVQRNTVDECLETIREGEADIITLDGSLAEKARTTYGLKPIVAEKYGPSGGAYYAVAVVRKNSPFNSFGDLRGAKSCHTGVGRTAGYNAPLHTLIKLGLMKNQCPKEKLFAEFFTGGSCMPGAKDPKWKLDTAVSDKLCSLCAGNVEGNDKTTKCNFDSSESYSGYTGAFRCLVEGGGDVAFVKHVTVPGNTDGNNKDKWAANLKSSDYELLCPNGGRAPVSEYKKCYLAHAPPHMVVTGGKKTTEDIQEIQDALLATSDLYSKRPDYFKLFGSWNGKKDLLFKDSATGLFSINDNLDVLEEYSKVLSSIKGCD